MSITQTSEDHGTNQLKTVLETIIQSGQLELPLLPDVVSRLMQQCEDPNCPARTIADSIRHDPAIASHVLRIANSMMYSAGLPIVSLQQAVARLGMEKIREIVMVIFCQGRAFEVAGFEREVRESFRHSIGTAAFSQVVARTIRANVEQAFLCGLLHAVGRPVLYQALVDSGHADDFQHDEIIAAVESLHISTGELLINTWQLPSEIAETVRDQRLDSDTENQHATILNLAIQLTDELLNEEVPDEQLESASVTERLNLYAEQLADIRGHSDVVLDLIKNTL